MRSIAVLLLICASSIVTASDYRPLETNDQARQRQSAENYEKYKANRNEAPLGGYNQPLGSPTPYGVERPGYTPQGYESNRPPPSYGGDWRERAKR